MMALKDLIDRLQDGAPDEPFPVRRIRGVRVTADEVREALAANADHPSAWIFARAVEGLEGDAPLFVDRTDMLGLATNRAVLKRRVREGEDTILTKELGDSLARGPKLGSAPAAVTPVSLPPREAPRPRVTKPIDPPAKEPDAAAAAPPVDPPPAAK
jgi:hypothetical protein